MRTHLLLPLFFALCISSCKEDKKQIDWTPLPLHSNTQPYGTYLFHKLMKHHYSSATMTTLSSGYRFTSITDNMQFKERPNLLFIIGMSFYLSEEEQRSIMAFARSGNEVIIVSQDRSSELLKFLSVSSAQSVKEYTTLPFKLVAQQQKRLSIQPNKEKYYGYRGRNITGQFEIDTAALYGKKSESLTDYEYEPSMRYGQFDKEIAIEILGYYDNQPNFIRYRTGEGHISIHAAPLVFSNYFLLQNGNIKYLENFFNHLPQDIQNIYWIDFDKRHAARSTLGVLLRYPATRWAFWLALTGLLLYVVMEGKRRQRIIPQLKANQNTTVLFVETVGRLYYNKGNHNNLAEKMTQHFLEWVRTQYYLPTTTLDEKFIKNLSTKSGKPIEETQTLIDAIIKMRESYYPINEQALLNFYHQLQNFYEK